MGDKSSNLLLVVFAFFAGLGLGAAGTLLLRPQQTAPAATPPGGAANAPAAATTAGGATAAPATARQPAAAVFINQRQATPQQLHQLKQTYGAVPPPGRYWYDARSGL